MSFQFHETVRGKVFYDHHVPALIEGVNRLAAAIEESNRLQLATFKATADNEANAADKAEKVTFFCYTASDTARYNYTTFCRSARETIMWADTQIEEAMEEGFEIANPFGAEREFFGAIATEKKAEILLKHSDGRVRHIGFERE